ncbi:MAG: GNAT family N-acetyltransferase [Chloroflexi bacterium]|nr:GNAT family N-acetyltransferase [Chloroflexota bacterium]
MLKGERLTLRAIERDDLPRYVAWLNDPEVIEHLLAHLPFNLDDETDWYESQRKDSTMQNFAMVVSAENLHIGSIGLMGINQREQQAELGIMIGDKTHWNQGYGREAIQLVLLFGFNILNLHRIYLRVDASHPAAIRCYLSCGFVEEGRLRDAAFRQGRFEDQLIMSILRPEYLRGNKVAE